MSESKFADLSNGSCLQEAYAPENEPHSYLVSDLLGSDAYSELQMQIQNDKRMIDLQVDWSRCMAAEGYDYGSSQEIKDQLFSQGNAIAQQIVETGARPDNAEISELLASYKSDEVTLAVADWNCSVDYFTVAPAIVREHEINFIEENEALILEILAAKAN